MLKTLIRTVAGIALLLASLQLVYWSAVRRQVRQLAEAVAPVADLSYENIDAFPPGSLALNGVRLSVRGFESLHLQADRVALHHLDRLWLLGWLAGREQPPVRRFALQVDGLNPSPAMLQALRRRAGALGLTLPFEAVGCADGGTFGHDDYAVLDWQALRLDLLLDWRRRPELRRVDIDLRVDRHPSGVLLAQLGFVEVSERNGLFSRGLGGARLDSASLRYDNDDALRQRNQLCAARAGADADFHAEHLRRVHELLRGLGVVPDEPIWEAYAAWSAQGGTLTLTAEPAPGVSFSEYPAFAPEDRLRLLGLALQVANGEPVPVEAIGAHTGAVAFRPLPEDLEQVPGMDAGQDDGGSAPPAGGGDPPGEQAGAATVVPAPRPGIVARAIAFDELGSHHGGQVRIATVSGGRHVGVILDSTSDAVELQIVRYGGAARLPIVRDQISRIELLEHADPDH